MAGSKRSHPGAHALDPPYRSNPGSQDPRSLRAHGPWDPSGTRPRAVEGLPADRQLGACSPGRAGWELSVVLKSLPPLKVLLVIWDTAMKFLTKSQVLVPRPAPVLTEGRAGTVGRTLQSLLEGPRPCQSPGPHPRVMTDKPCAPDPEASCQLTLAQLTLPLEPTGSFYLRRNPKLVPQWPPHSPLPAAHHNLLGQKQVSGSPQPKGSPDPRRAPVVTLKGLSASRGAGAPDLGHPACPRRLRASSPRAGSPVPQQSTRPVGTRAVFHHPTGAIVPDSLITLAPGLKPFKGSWDKTPTR